jgi:hypothetical protein
MRKLPTLHMVTAAIFTFGCFVLNAQFKETVHQDIPEGIVAVKGSGNYGEPGTTYMLTGDITSDRSALFLGKDVTLDLNGYTLTYADGNYEHVPNYGFEEGLNGWDVSNAPGAKIENTADVHQLI